MRPELRDLRDREAATLERRTATSGELYARARRVLAGGVASSFQRREPWPVHLARGEGARVWDVDGNEYLDFHNGFSTMLQGHAHPAIGAAVAARYELGTLFAAPTEDGIAVAEELSRRFGLPRWRFTNSGTESTMGAVRTARAITGRDDVVRILGTYHGHGDTLLVGAGEGRDRGVPPATAELVHSVAFNDAEAMERRLTELGREGRAAACVVMEPVMTHVGIALPREGYLERVRELTRRHGALLIFDEVKTGLSVAAGGAIERFGVEPDLLTLAKALGGGLPTGAIGLSADVAAAAEGMPHLGTFNAHPLGMAAARASLTEVLTPAAYERLFALNDRLLAGCDAAIAEHELPAHTVGLGAKGCIIHASEPVTDYESFKRVHDPELAELAWLWSMNRGLFVTPGRGQDWTLSVAHDAEAVDRYVEVFAELAEALSPRSSGSTARTYPPVGT